MEEKLNFFNRFNLSFKPSRYSLYIKEGLHKSIIYVLILSCVLGLIKGVLFAQVYSTSEEQFIKVLKDSKYSFTFENSKLTMKGGPVSVEQGSNLFLIDTTKSLQTINELDKITVHKDYSFVMVSDGFVYNTLGQKSTVKYSDIFMSTFTLDNNKLIAELESVSFVKYILVIVFIIGVFMSILFNGLLIAIAGILSDKMNKTNLGFGNVFKFSLYAMTFPMLLQSIIPLGTAKILVAGFMVVYAIGKIKMNETKSKIEL